MKFEFTVLKNTYAIYRLDNDAAIPAWTNMSDFYSITRTRDELSIVCKQTDIKEVDNIMTDKNWKILKISGPLDLASVGIIADISSLLRNSKIPIFSVSTYDTDYILIKNQNLETALAVLKDNGNSITVED
jgi:hypothetical protein